MGIGALAIVFAIWGSTLDGAFKVLMFTVACVAGLLAARDSR